MPRPYESEFKPLFTDEDVQGVVTAVDEFKKAVDANLSTLKSAEQAVAMTLSWVGAGEKLLAIAKTVIERESSNSKQPKEKKDQFVRMQEKLGKFTELANSVKTLFPTSMG